MFFHGERRSTTLRPLRRFGSRDVRERRRRRVRRATGMSRLTLIVIARGQSCFFFPGERKPDQTPAGGVTAALLFASISVTADSPASPSALRQTGDHGLSSLQRT